MKKNKYVTKYSLPEQMPNQEAWANTWEKNLFQGTKRQSKVDRNQKRNP